jgi:hypothetical protein
VGWTAASAHWSREGEFISGPLAESYIFLESGGVSNCAAFIKKACSLLPYRHIDLLTAQGLGANWGKASDRPAADGSHCHEFSFDEFNVQIHSDESVVIDPEALVAVVQKSRGQSADMINLLGTLRKKQARHTNPKNGILREMLSQYIFMLGEPMDPYAGQMTPLGNEYGWLRFEADGVEYTAAPDDVSGEMLWRNIKMPAGHAFGAVSETVNMDYFMGQGHALEWFDRGAAHGYRYLFENAEAIIYSDENGVVGAEDELAIFAA